MPTSYVFTPMRVLGPPMAIGASGRAADIATSPSGSVTATTDGDLTPATPVAALRAEVQRMMSNPPNAYAHLRGWGARPPRGALARPTDLARIQLQAERYLREHPFIASARVQALNAPRGARNAILLAVTIDTVDGVTDEFTTPLGGS